jgi:hypothetical protein
VGTPGLKGASAFLTGSQWRLDIKSADFEPPRYLIFRESGSPIWKPFDSRILSESWTENVHDSPAILRPPPNLVHPHPGSVEPLCAQSAPDHARSGPVEVAR